MSQNILREYLVALGFRVDQRGSRQINGILTHLDKRTKFVAKGLLGVAAAATVMTHRVAKSMEKMFYASRYADTTVANLQAIEFGFRSIGMQAGQGTQALKGMTAAIRSNPGLIGLLNSLGIPVQGRDKAAVMLDLVAALKRMPFHVAERYASLFGIDPETLFNMQAGLDKLKQTAELRKQMAGEMGVDADKAAAAAVKYAQLWEEAKERAGLFKDALAIELLPVVQEIAGVSNEVMKDWVRIVKEINSAGTTDFWQRIREGVRGKAEGGGVVLSQDAKRRLGLPTRDGRNNSADPAVADAVTDMEDFKGRTSSASDPAAGDDENGGGVDEPGFDPKEYLANLERKYGLPKGILDRVWKRESNRGDPKFMRSPAGAKGHFGFMDKTAKEYGLNDPDDFTESADASARKWRDLLKRYGGDTRKAAAAYNWGDGRLAQHGLSRAPKETREYMDAVAGPAGGSTLVEAKPEIHIHGVSDPKAAAAHVIEAQQQVNADIVRNMSPKIR